MAEGSRVMQTDYSVLADSYAVHRRAHPGVLGRLAAELSPSSRVLELGCGTDNYLAAIRQSVGCDCVGVDPSPHMLAKLRARGLLIRTIDGRAEALDLLGEQFDLIYSVDVIHHAADRDATIRATFQSLRSGGLVCTVTFGMDHSTPAATISVLSGDCRRRACEVSEH